MPDFVVHDEASAPEASQQLLEHSKTLYGGMIPNLHGIMAESPALLEAYQSLNAIFEKTSFDTTEQHIVWLTANYENGCTYCMAAHTAIALYAGVDEQDVAALRTGKPLANARHQALREFTRVMVTERGWASSKQMDQLLAEGYTRQTMLDVVLAIGMKTLSNYTNHIAHTPVDRAFEKHAWEAE